MNEVFYNKNTNNWQHPNQQWRFGDGAVVIGNTSDSYRFVVQQKQNRLGPLVGIFTSGTASGKVYGDFKRFSAIQRELQKQGGISFIFTPFGLSEQTIEGYVRLENGKWRKCMFPYPDVVYNRIPYRSHEQKQEVQHTFTLLSHKGIPVFNPSFFSKWEIYKAFRENPNLQKHLLDTVPLYIKDDLAASLAMHKTIYIKQSESTKGKHIFQAAQHGAKLLVKDSSGKRDFVPFEDMWARIAHSNKLYIAQNTLIHDEQNGRKYDLRIVAHFLGGAFHISGIGVRLGAKGSIVTHVPNGGEILHVENLSRPIRYEILKTLVRQCGKSLCDHFGRVREFSLDIGVDQTGHYYIFEANAKPMVFDETAIERAVMRNLTAVFAEEAGFSPLMT
ncbi:MAG: YheC/YheD family protein [Ectobacillus sp.]